MTDGTSVYIFKTTKDQAREIARLERRTLSEVIAIAIEQRLKAISPLAKHKPEVNRE